jgi:hypothetical protein
MSKFEVDERVKLDPPYGPHIGKEAVIVKQHKTIGTSEEWYDVKLDNGEVLTGPANWIQKIPSLEKK